MILKKLLPPLVSLLVLTGCKPAFKEIDADWDTSSWQRHCLGYQSFLAPPDFRFGPQSATVADVSITVRRGDATPLNQAISARDDFGRTINSLKVNGWTVVVATVQDDLLESSYDLHLIGAQRVGEDVVVGYQNISREDYSQGDDPALWSWFAQTTPRKERKADLTKGYCVDGIIFESNLAREESASFMMRAAVAGADNARSQGTLRSDTDLTLTALYDEADDIDDDRMLAQERDVSALPGFSVTQERLLVAGRQYDFATVSFMNGEKSAEWYEAIRADGPQELEPNAMSVKFQDTRLNAKDSKAQMLAILASLRSGC